MAIATIRPLAPQEAIAALAARRRNVVETFAWQDNWQEDHANMATVAKSTGFDIINDIFDAVEAALKDGKSIRDATRDLVPILQAKGWWGRSEMADPLTGEVKSVQLGSTRRLKTIFDVNLRVSYAAGHWAQFEAGKAARPYLRYVAVLDQRTRPEHARLHNLCLPVDHDFWRTWAPPNGWSCRCTLQSLSERDVERMRGQLKFDPPRIPTRSWTNRRTGEVTEVPEGIDPGWAYNPGQAGSRAASAYADKLVAAPPELAAAAAADPAFPATPLADEFSAWVSAIEAGQRVDRSIYTVGALDRAVLDALAQRGIQPQSAAITVTQRAIGHAVRDLKREAGIDLPAELLQRLPETIRTARAVLRDRRDGALLYVIDVDGDTRLGKLVVRIDYGERARPAGGERVTIISNALRTAGMVDPVRLRDATFYEVLAGSV